LFVCLKAEDLFFLFACSDIHKNICEMLEVDSNSKTLVLERVNFQILNILQKYIRWKRPLETRSLRLLSPTSPVLKYMYSSADYCTDKSIRYSNTDVSSVSDLAGLCNNISYASWSILFTPEPFPKAFSLISVSSISHLQA